MKEQLTLGSLFSGSGGFELGGAITGIKPVWNSEIEPFPIRVTTKRFPTVKHYGDINTLKGSELEPVDIITGGSPCFPSGTLVLTSLGYMEIERIKVGMKVLTHEGRWRKVTATGSKTAQTITLKGNHYGLECTPNHPIYSTEMYWKRVDKVNKRFLSDEKNWTPAEDMKNKFWAVPNTIEFLEIPRPVPTNANMKELPPFDEDFFYLVGRWLGDGWVTKKQKRSRPGKISSAEIIICAGYDKEERLKEAVETVIDRYTVERCRTVVKYKFTSLLLCDWLTENFGYKAHGKEIPSWAFSMPESWREALLRGVLDTDGHRASDTMYRVTTVSKKLAHSLRLLGETLGYSTAVFRAKMPPTCVIEKRVCNQRDQYCVQLVTPSKRSRLSDDKHSWYRAKKVLPGDGAMKTVYNLTVEEDNSYIAEGIVVHNCQNFSVAGNRKGLEGEKSSLFYQFIRIVKEMREATGGQYPRFMVLENVTGLFSSNKGEDFRRVIEEICNVKYNGVHIPQPQKWERCGLIVEDDFSLSWRVFDAQYWGVPQRRKRIYLVADFRGQCAGKILFESEGMYGNTQESGIEGQSPSGSAESGTRGAEQNSLMFSNHAQDSRYNGPLETADTVTHRYGTGGNNQPLVLNPKTFDVRFTSENTRNKRANCYETAISRCLDTGGSNPDSNHGGVAIVEPSYGIGRPVFTQAYNSRFSFQIEEERVPTLVSSGPGAVGVHYSASKNSFFTKAVREKAETLVATDYKDPPIVNDENKERYIVRRLTPRECARLQGFPDWWCSELSSDNPTPEEIEFFRSVFMEHDRVLGKTPRRRTDTQIRKWLKNPHTDSAEYKLWGNGVSLPIIVYVLGGIAFWAERGEEKNEL